MRFLDFMKKGKSENGNHKSSDLGVLYTDVYPTIQKTIKPLEDEMIRFAQESKKAKTVDKKIEALEKAIQSFYLLKKKCAALGENYKRYFSEMWEHCHNSKNADFCYVEQLEKELSKLRGKL